MNLKPLDDRVIVKAKDAEEVSRGGVVLPTAAQEKPQEGLVVAVGPGRHTESGSLIEPTVLVGDEVLYTKYGGTEMKVDGVEHLILKESDILAVIG